MAPKIPRASTFATYTTFWHWQTSIGLAKLGITEQPPPALLALYRSFLAATPPPIDAAWLAEASCCPDFDYEFLTTFVKWDRTLRLQGNLLRSDAWRIRSSFSHLSSIYRCIVERSTRDASEADRRHGFDELFRFCFETGASKIIYEKEASVRLVQQPNIAIGRLAVADGLASVKRFGFPHEVNLVLLQNGHSTGLCFEQMFDRDQVSPDKPLRVAAASCEYKNLPQDLRVAENQLCYSLSSAQLQRKALGLPPGFVWGFAAAASSMTVNCYACWWHVGHLRYCCLHAWDLNDLRSFFELLCFVQNLRDSVGTQIQQELNALVVGNVATRLVTMPPWRS